MQRLNDLNHDLFKLLAANVLNAIYKLMDNPDFTAKQFKESYPRKHHIWLGFCQVANKNGWNIDATNRKIRFYKRNQTCQI